MKIIMNKNGPIIVMEDDEDDRALLKEIFLELGHPNEVVFFEYGAAALAYMQDKDTNPFLILSDINLPGLDGLELKRRAQASMVLRKKCVPYIFFSTQVDAESVADAYTHAAHGFFQKPASYDEMSKTIRLIMDYWKKSYSPNNFPQYQ